MNKGIPIVLLAAAVLFGGCAAVTPWQEQVRTFPKIGLGDVPPADGNYVLHLPAGKPFPTNVIIKGDLIREQEPREVLATPTKDIYFYKNQVSFDLKNWAKARAKLDMAWDIGVPSWEKPRPGHLSIILNERQP